MDNFVLKQILFGKKKGENTVIAEACLKDIDGRSEFYVCLKSNGQTIEICDADYSIFHDLVMDEQGIDDGAVEQYIEMCQPTKINRAALFKDPSNAWNRLYRRLLFIAETGNSDLCKEICGKPITSIRD